MHGAEVHTVLILTHSPNGCVRVVSFHKLNDSTWETALISQTPDHCVHSIFIRAKGEIAAWTAAGAAEDVPGELLELPSSDSPPLFANIERLHKHK